MGTKMSELKVKDPGMYKAIHDKWEKKKKARTDALAVLIAFATAKGSDTEKNAAKLLTVRAAGTGRVAGAPSYMTVLNTMFKDGPAIHEDRVFKDFRLGRAEMRHYTVNAIKKAKPEDRLWVAFDPATGQYNLKGRGANPPAGWVGYKPLVVDGAEVK